MTQEEIKQKIDSNNKKIEELFDPSGFALIKEIQPLLEENLKLQSICKHEYKNKQCIYCYRVGE